MKRLKNMINAIRYGQWCCGCEFWDGKPMWSSDKQWHDGWHYVLHVGPIYVECHYGW